MRQLGRCSTAQDDLVTGAMSTLSGCFLLTRRAHSDPPCEQRSRPSRVPRVHRGCGHGAHHGCLVRRVYHPRWAHIAFKPETRSRVLSSMVGYALGGTSEPESNLAGFIQQAKDQVRHGSRGDRLSRRMLTFRTRACAFVDQLRHWGPCEECARYRVSSNLHLSFVREQ